MAYFTSDYQHLHSYKVTSLNNNFNKLVSSMKRITEKNKHKNCLSIVLDVQITKYKNK